MVVHFIKTGPQIIKGYLICNDKMLTRTYEMYRVQLQLGVTSIRLRDACHTSTHPIQINMVYNIDIMCSFPRCDSYLLNDNFVYGTKRKMNSLLMAGQLLV